MARLEGRVARSQDVVAMASLVVGLATLVALGTTTVGRLGRVVRSSFESLGDRARPPIVAELRELFVDGLAVLGPVAAAVWAAAVLSGVGQTGGLVRPDAIAPRTAHVSLRGGIARLVSWRAASRGVFAVLKLGVLAWGLASAWDAIRDPEGPLGAKVLAAADLDVAVAELGRGLGSFVLRVGGALLVVAALDWVVERALLERELRMSRQEIIEEQKEQQVGREVREGQARQRRRIQSILASRPDASATVRDEASDTDWEEGSR